jgi:hypothetical protein
MDSYRQAYSYYAARTMYNDDLMGRRSHTSRLRCQNITPFGIPAAALQVGRVIQTSLPWGLLRHQKSCGCCRSQGAGRNREWNARSCAEIPVHSFPWVPEVAFSYGVDNVGICCRSLPCCVSSPLIAWFPARMTQEQLLAVVRVRDMLGLTYIH